MAERGADNGRMTIPVRTQPSLYERRSRALSLALAGGLLLLCLGWDVLLNRSWFGVLMALPLAAALPGLARFRLYTYRWVALLVWLYACEGLVHLGSSQGLPRALGTAEALLAIGLFAAVTWHIRLRLGAAKAHAA